MGRRKIEIKKLENVRNRNATFKKRRQGILKKAHELATLTDSKVTLSIKNGDAFENHVFNNQAHDPLSDTPSLVGNNITTASSESDLFSMSKLEDELMEDVLVVPSRPDPTPQWSTDPTSMNYDQSLDFIFDPLALSVRKPFDGYDFDLNSIMPLNSPPEIFGHSLLTTNSPNDTFLSVERYDDCDWLSGLLDFNNSGLACLAAA